MSTLSLLVHKWGDWQDIDTVMSSEGLKYLVLNFTAMQPEAMKYGSIQRQTDIRQYPIIPVTCQRVHCGQF